MRAGDACAHACACACVQVPQPVRKPAEPGRGGKGKPAEKEKVGLAMLKNIHMSPKKLALWAKMVRGLHVEDAMIQCTVRVNKGAKILAEVGPVQQLTLHKLKLELILQMYLGAEQQTVIKRQVMAAVVLARQWVDLVLGMPSKPPGCMFLLMASATVDVSRADLKQADCMPKDQQLPEHCPLYADHPLGARQRGQQLRAEPIQAGHRCGHLGFVGMPEPQPTWEQVLG